MIIRKIAGILQILISMLFPVSVTVINLIGIWLAIPFPGMLVIILRMEHRVISIDNSSAATI